MTSTKKDTMLSGRLHGFEQAFAALNEAFFESKLSNSVISISPTRHAYGHFTPYESWEDEAGRYCEINLGAATINRPFEQVMATLAHEMVHQYCYENGLQDTSRNGYYHNKRFKQEAERRGLVISKHKSCGWTITEPSEAFCKFSTSKKFENARAVLHRLDCDSPREARQSTREYSCPACGGSVRATREVNIGCLDCNCKMELATREPL